MKNLTSAISSLSVLLSFNAVTLSANPAWSAVDEIIVTARKRAESLQDVPLSISAFDLEGLRQRNIQNVYDVATFSPNFGIARNLGRRLDAPTVRGQNSPLLGQSNASFYIDGVFVSGSSGSITVDNLERVEILRGPQAALFGRATFSGAMNFITRKPSNDFEGEVNLKLGTNEDYKTSAWVSGPIVEDKLFYFASASWEHFGGEWNNNLLAGETTSFIPSWVAAAPSRGDTSSLGGEETVDLTGKLTITPTENLEINLKATYNESDDEHFPALYHSASMNNCNGGAWYCGELKADGLSTKVNIPVMQDGVNAGALGNAAPAPFIGARSRIHRYLGEIKYDLKDWELVARATYNTIDDDYVRDLDRMPFSLAGLFESHSYFRTSDTSYEARIASPIEHRVRGILGAYYYESKGINIARNFPFPRPDFTLTGLNRVKNEAIFGSIDFDIINELTFTYDWRYAEDTLTRNVTAPDALALGVPPFAQETFDSYTPRYTLSYKPNEDMNIYALAAKGNKPGGFNFAFFDSDVVPAEISAALADGRAFIEEEEAWTYELGIKTSGLWDDRLSLNAAVYYIDWSNQAINENADIAVYLDAARTVIGVEPNNIVRNAGKSEVVGLEIESILNLNENLTFTFNYGLADTELLEFNSENIRDYSGVPFIPLADGGNAKGKEAPRVPKHNANFSATYTDTLPNADMDWYVRSDLVYESKKWQSPLNQAYVGDLYLWNARVGLESEQWGVSLYVDNILDDDTPTLAQTFPDFLHNSNFEAFFLNPRRGTNAGLTAQFRF